MAEYHSKIWFSFQETVKLSILKIPKNFSKFGTLDMKMNKPACATVTWTQLISKFFKVQMTKAPSMVWHTEALLLDQSQDHLVNNNSNVLSMSAMLMYATPHVQSAVSPIPITNVTKEADPTKVAELTLRITTNILSNIVLPLPTKVLPSEQSSVENSSRRRKPLLESQVFKILLR